MSTLWYVEVLSKEKNKIKLKIHAAHPDSLQFHESKQFALMLLFDEAIELDANYKKVATGALGELINDNDITNKDFMGKNAGKFVKSIKISDIKNENEIGGEAIYEIEVTDLKWIEHLHKGQKWRSAAYDPCI